jgi:PAS domain S-box-containing protein
MHQIKTIHVLLVEDEANEAKLVKIKLQQSQSGLFDVTWAQSLKEAQHYLATASFDVLLLDLSLPDSEGLATVYSARVVAKNTPIVILSGQGDTDFALGTLEAGADDFMVKGDFGYDGLARVIRHTLLRTEMEARNTVLIAALEAAANGIVITDKDAAVIWANPAFSLLTGYSLEEVVGNKPSELVKSGLQDETFYQDMWATLLAGQQWRGELVNKRKNDSLYHEELSIAPVKNAAGETTHFISIKEDITGRKQADDMLRIAAVAFETHEGILVTDASQRILRVNNEFSHIYGYSSEEAIGHRPSFLCSKLHDEDFYHALWASIEQDGYWHGEIWDKRKSGEVFPLWLTITAVKDANGQQVTHYVGTFMDITAIKQAEKILLNARQLLENQVATTQLELEKIKEESQEITTALNVLLKHQQQDKADAQCELSRQLEGTVLPFLKKLKNANRDKSQLRLLDILESNLHYLVKTYGNDGSLSSIYQKLTPVEILVASMVRQGLPSKLIATSLHISLGTVSIHRKHIRKKLGLYSKGVNLSSYLKSLAK